MDASVIILLLATTLLAASVVYFVWSVALSRRSSWTAPEPRPTVQRPEEALPVRDILTTPVELGDWAPPASRRDHTPRVEMPADELSAKVAELSSAFQAAALLASPEHAPEPAPPSAPAGQAPVPASASARVAPDYTLVAPVELVFSDGSGRVGIRPGTETFLKYQHFAEVLLKDLRRTDGA